MAKRTRQPIVRTLTQRAQGELEKGGTVLPDDIPPLTPALAAIYAKMLTCGCPKGRAVLYCLPHLDVATEDGKALVRKVALAWFNDSMVQTAVNDIYGGAFLDLPPEQKFKLVIDKSNVEAAFFLWMSNFSEIEHKEGIEKLKLAREILKVELKQQPDAADPMQAFARFAFDMMRNVNKPGPSPFDEEDDHAPTHSQSKSGGPTGTPRLS